MSRRIDSGRFGFSGFGSVFDWSGIVGGIMVVVADDDVEPARDAGGFDTGRGGAFGISTTEGRLLLSLLGFDC